MTCLEETSSIQSEKEAAMMKKQEEAQEAQWEEKINDYLLTHSYWWLMGFWGFGVLLKIIDW
jgi:hypothetical protein